MVLDLALPEIPATVTSRFDSIKQGPHLQVPLLPDFQNLVHGQFDAPVALHRGLLGAGANYLRSVPPRLPHCFPLGPHSGEGHMS